MFFRKEFFKNIIKFRKAVTLNQVKGCFGFEGDSNIGKFLNEVLLKTDSYTFSTLNCYIFIFSIKTYSIINKKLNCVFILGSIT